MSPIKTLLLDNYDSFTFNLYQAVAEVTGLEPLVLWNDASWDELQAVDFDAVIISPGPGHPENDRDFGICARVIRELEKPILGVCLGHQGIAHVFGGSVVHAPEPVHGRVSRIRHQGCELLAGIPADFEAVRYHSLVVAEPLPACLEATAWSEGGLVMALRHRTRPIWGLQFHPESICTIEGNRILANFYRMCRERLGAAVRAPRHALPAGRAIAPRTMSRTSVSVRKVPCRLSAAAVFRRLFADAPYAYWLDHNVGGGWGGFSFMGGMADQTAEVVRYSVGEDGVRVQKGGSIEMVSGDLWSYLNRVLAERFVTTPELPFDFNCGYVGYFGYELKADCGARRAHRAPHPDCTLLFVDRQVVYDHQGPQLYLLWYGAHGSATERDSWFDWVTGAVGEERPSREETGPRGVSGPFHPVADRARYLARIRRCLEYVRDGESYEICLTNKLRAETTVDALEYYGRLRQTNPAPYSAFLRFSPLEVACSSPERFLRIGQDRTVESKPIKGTAARGRTPAEDEWRRRRLGEDSKNRAENLMIVDLLRNDLGRVCEVGTVAVPRLMDVESFATVHQLVSTIRGRLRSDCSAVDCLRHAFPGGSMTGAPKLRTLEILDGLEEEARGVYSGSIGFLALNGAADLNIVIRTAVFQGGEVSIGAGGAVVAMSDPEAEWDEMLLKTRALVAAFEAPSGHASEGVAAAEAGGAVEPLPHTPYRRAKV